MPGNNNLGLKRELRPSDYSKAETCTMRHPTTGEPIDIPVEVILAWRSGELKAKDGVVKPPKAKTLKTARTCTQPGCNNKAETPGSKWCVPCSVKKLKVMLLEFPVRDRRTILRATLRTL